MKKVVTDIGPGVISVELLKVYILLMVPIGFIHNMFYFKI